MERRGIAMLAAAAVLAAVGITQAGAAPFPVTPTKLTIQSNFAGGPTPERSGDTAARGGQLSFGGKVLSRKARCKRNRTVILYAGVNEFNGPVRAARRAPEGFVPIHAVKSKRGGNWRVADADVPFNADGRFVARVTRKRAFRARCKQARSEVIQIFAEA